MKWTVLIHLFSVNVFASQMIGAKSAGMGMTGRASVETMESLYLNPAAIGLMNDFRVGTSYQTGFLSKDYSRNTYSFTVTDATKGVLFPASLGYRRHSLNLAGRSAEEQEFRLATGWRLSRRLSFGLAGSHAKADLGAGETYDQTNIHMGALVGLMPNWGLSFTADGLLQDGDNNRPAMLNRLARVSVGTQYVYNNVLRVRWDILSPLRDSARRWDLSHNFGVGVIMQNNFNLHLGYSADDYLEQNWGSAGISWEGPRLKVAYSYQQESRQELGVRHLVDLWLDI